MAQQLLRTGEDFQIRKTKTGYYDHISNQES